MNTFASVRRLDVHRRLGNGERIPVGVLAQNTQGVFFQYDTHYIARFGNLSPFGLDADARLQPAPPTPHQGLHGVFADSLPDGWGLLLMDRLFRQHGILPAQVTAMDRLACIGEKGSGALTYAPASDWQAAGDAGWLPLSLLGQQAETLYEGHASTLLATLAAAGSSGGARPKAQLYFRADDYQHASTVADEGREPWLVKFTSTSLALGHEEGLCEAAYLTLARMAGIDTPEWQLIPATGSQAIAWLALKRFDCTPAGGRLHLHSAGGLLDTDFRLPSLDYEELIKASQMLCKSPSAGQRQFRCAAFNLFGLNQDDHSKNWAFLQDDAGQWTPAPFFDVTFSPGPHGEHRTAFAGHGKQPPLKAMQQLARQASFAHWQEAKDCITEVIEALSHWDDVAAGLGVRASTRKIIGQQLSAVYVANKGLLSQG
ncbi:MAG: type II toxin-antitoxin system HipA family toxin [Moraxellaceae bacterium]|nr:type II toxin-antitoxin system HipA family toxin [Moraxellaceae bacterium]